MSMIEAVTVTLYRAVNRPKGYRIGKPRRQKRLAYRDAAWAKLRERCECGGDGAERRLCRFHDREFRAEDYHGGPDFAEHGFAPPPTWGLPRSHDLGLWDYGRAVAYRLARWYQHLDNREHP